MKAVYLGWGIADKTLRCGCRTMIVFESVGRAVIATCPVCLATWDMVVQTAKAVRK